MDVFDFTLTAEDIAALDSLNMYRLSPHPNFYRHLPHPNLNPTLTLTQPITHPRLTVTSSLLQRDFRGCVPKITLADGTEVPRDATNQFFPFNEAF